VPHRGDALAGCDRVTFRDYKLDDGAADTGARRYEVACLHPSIDSLPFRHDLRTKRQNIGGKHRGRRHEPYGKRQNSRCKGGSGDSDTHGSFLAVQIEQAGLKPRRFSTLAAGQRPVKADWNMLKPTKTVSQTK